MALKLKAQRKTVDFTYELKDGKEIELSFTAMNTKQIDETMNGGSTKKLLKLQRKVLLSNVNGDEKDINKMIAELEEYGNLYDFMGSLQEAVGKQKKKG